MIKKCITLFLVLALCLPLALASCKSSPPVRDPVPMADLFYQLLEGGGKNPDDIMIAPTGLAYIANTHVENITSEWPPVSMTHTTLEVDERQAHVTYRSSIETRAGETRNNIVEVFIPNRMINNLEWYTESLPRGVTITDGLQWAGSFSRSAVLVMNISENISTGDHNFRIGVLIDGVDWGALPCTIKVVK